MQGKVGQKIINSSADTLLSSDELRDGFFDFDHFDACHTDVRTRVSRLTPIFEAIMADLITEDDSTRLVEKIRSLNRDIDKISDKIKDVLVEFANPALRANQWRQLMIPGVLDRLGDDDHSKAAKWIMNQDSFAKAAEIAKTPRMMNGAGGQSLSREEAQSALNNMLDAKIKDGVANYIKECHKKKNYDTHDKLVLLTEAVSLTCLADLANLRSWHIADIITLRQDGRRVTVNLRYSYAIQKGLVDAYTANSNLLSAYQSTIVHLINKGHLIFGPEDRFLHHVASYPVLIAKQSGSSKSDRGMSNYRTFKQFLLDTPADPDARFLVLNASLPSYIEELIAVALSAPSEKSPLFGLLSDAYHRWWLKTKKTGEKIEFSSSKITLHKNDFFMAKFEKLFDEFTEVPVEENDRDKVAQIDDIIDQLGKLAQWWDCKWTPVPRRQFKSKNCCSNTLIRDDASENPKKGSM